MGETLSRSTTAMLQDKENASAAWNAHAHGGDRGAFAKDPAARSILAEKKTNVLANNEVPGGKPLFKGVPSPSLFKGWSLPSTDAERRVSLSSSHTPVADTPSSLKSRAEAFLKGIEEAEPSELTKRKKKRIKITGGVKQSVKGEPAQLNMTDQLMEIVTMDGRNDDDDDEVSIAPQHLAKRQHLGESIQQSTGTTMQHLRDTESPVMWEVVVMDLVPPPDKDSEQQTRRTVQCTDGAWGVVRNPDAAVATPVAPLQPIEPMWTSTPAVATPVAHSYYTRSASMQAVEPMSTLAEISFADISFQQCSPCEEEV